MMEQRQGASLEKDDPTDSDPAKGVRASLSSLYDNRMPSSKAYSDEHGSLLNGCDRTRREDEEAAERFGYDSERERRGGGYGSTGGEGGVRERREGMIRGRHRRVILEKLREEGEDYEGYRREEGEIRQMKSKRVRQFYREQVLSLYSTIE